MDVLHEKQIIKLFATFILYLYSYGSDNGNKNT